MDKASKFTIMATLAILQLVLILWVLSTQNKFDVLASQRGLSVKFFTVDSPSRAFLVL